MSAVSAPPSVVIVDDHALFRAGVRAELERAVEVLGDADDVDGRRADDPRRARPTSSLLDVHLPGGGGVEVIRQVAAEQPDAALPRALGLRRRRGRHRGHPRRRARLRDQDDLRAGARRRGAPGATRATPSSPRGWRASSSTRSPAQMTRRRGRPRARPAHRRASARSSSTSPAATSTRRSPCSSASARRRSRRTSAPCCASSSFDAARAEPLGGRPAAGGLNSLESRAAMADRTDRLHRLPGLHRGPPHRAPARGRPRRDRRRARRAADGRQGRAPPRRRSTRSGIEVQPGDITDPKLGPRTTPATSAWPRATTSVHHLAAIYDLARRRGARRARERRSAPQHIVDFCRAAPNLERHNYVSTAYVAGWRSGRVLESELAAGQEFKNHYESTKFAAEVIVRGVDGRGPDDDLPAGDRRRRLADRRDAEVRRPLLLLRLDPGRRRMGTPIPQIGNGAAPFNVVPVDFVVEAIAAGARDAEAAGETFHLTDPEPVNSCELVNILAREYAGQRAGLPHPARRWSSARCASTPLRKLFGGAPPEAIPYLNHPVRFDTARTRRDARAPRPPLPALPGVRARDGALLPRARGRPGVRAGVLDAAPGLALVLAPRERAVALEPPRPPRPPRPLGQPRTGGRRGPRRDDGGAAGARGQRRGQPEARGRPPGAGRPARASGQAGRRAALRSAMGLRSAATPLTPTGARRRARSGRPPHRTSAPCDQMSRSWKPASG